MAQSAQLELVPRERFTPRQVLDWIAAHPREYAIWSKPKLARAWCWSLQNVKTWLKHNPRGAKHGRTRKRAQAAQIERIDAAAAVEVAASERGALPADRPAPCPDLQPDRANEERPGAGIAPRLGLFLLVVGWAMIPLAIGINAQTGWRFGTDPQAAVTFAGLSALADALTIALPSAALALWLARRWIAGAAAWCVWSTAMAAAVLASIGFASLNLSDTRAARAAAIATVVESTVRRAGAIEAAQAAVRAAAAGRQAECQYRGPRCRALEVVEQGRMTELAAAIAVPLPAAVPITDSDPQVSGAVRLAAWAGLRVDGADVGNLRLALMALLPNLAGLVLAFGWALRRSSE